MSTEEAYSRATRASRLVVKEAHSDVDTIIAAGMAEPLGVLLVRMRTEWDTISAREIALAANDTTARLLILMNLRSLPAAKEAMFNFALAKAESRGCMSDTKAIAAVVGRALDVWLDRRCGHCEGRGFNGGYGVPKLMCVGKGKCGGTGNRRNSQLSANASEHALGVFLLTEMDRKATNSMGQIARKTRRT